MLATESESSERAASALSGWAISPAPAIITFDYGLLFPAKSSSSTLREVLLFRSLYNILHFQSKRNSSGKRTLSLCLSLWISEGDSLGTREPHVVCSCVFPRGRMHRACWEKACFLSKLWSGDRIAWSSVATTRDSQRRQATVLWLYPILLN